MKLYEQSPPDTSQTAPAGVTTRCRISPNKERVKLSGDGTNIGKRLHVINFTFTLLDEGSAIKFPIFLTGAPSHITQNPENQSLTTGANSGKPSYEAELGVREFRVKHV